MPIVNFSLPTTLEKQIATVVKKKGFASKAEFFRFVAMRYIEQVRAEESGRELHWIFKDPKALATLLKGMDNAEKGKVKRYATVNDLFRSLHARTSP